MVLAIIVAVGLGAAEPAAEASPEPASAAGLQPGSDAEAEDGRAVADGEDEGPDDEVPDDVGAEPSESEPSEPSEPTDEGGSDGGISTGGPSSSGPSGGALPSGQARSDDESNDDDELHEARSPRRRGSPEREDGQWQVLAPYPELGPIRYRDPETRRMLWLGADVTGTYLPPSLGLSDRTVWMVRPVGAWAFALTPWLAVGGRHGAAWYDAEDSRLRVHEHQVELSGRPLAGSRPGVTLDDRLAVGVTTHAIRWSDEAGITTEPSDLRDTIVHVGYGLDHLLGTRWRLGWKAQGRYAWVQHDTQRQVRVSTRLAFHPRPAHRLSVDAVGYYVHRDAEPAGVELSRNSVYGQLGLGYAWVGRAGVGPWTHVRATSGFMSGEAPVYELRAEALEAGYGEVLVGMLARWP